MEADMKRRHVFALMAGLVLAACASAPAPEPVPVDEAAAITLFLMRHGEKEGGDDPALSAAGVARAEALVARLGSSEITEIWSTQTRRTQATAAPLAAATGLPIQIYDPATLPAFAVWLLDTPGVKVVVGHSNTTDTLAGLLGADPGPAINDASEFDRLYVIHVEDAGIVRSRIERYGAPSQVEADAPE